MKYRTTGSPVTRIFSSLSGPAALVYISRRAVLSFWWVGLSLSLGCVNRVLAQPDLIFVSEDCVSFMGEGGTYVRTDIVEEGCNCYNHLTENYSVKVFYAGPVNGELWFIDNGLCGSPGVGRSVCSNVTCDPSLDCLCIAVVLPVELIRFTAQFNSRRGIELEWATATETNNQGFEVQRSADGKNWGLLGFVSGHGTTQEEHTYYHADEQPLPGLSYYRLRQVDFDGRVEYSRAITVVSNREEDNLLLFPNPAKGSVTITLETEYYGEAFLALYNSFGRRVKKQLLVMEGRPYHTAIGLSGLPAGVYLAQVQAGRRQWWKQLIVE